MTRLITILLTILLSASGAWGATYYATNFSGTYRYAQDAWPTAGSTACSANHIQGCLASVGANNTLVMDGGASGTSYTGAGNNPAIQNNGQTLRGPIATDPDFATHGGAVTLSGSNATQINVNKKDNVTISNLTLTSYTSQGILLSNTDTALTALTIEDVVFSGANAQAIYVAVSGTGSLGALTLSDLTVGAGTMTNGINISGGGLITNAAISNIAITSTGITTNGISCVGVVSPVINTVTVSGTSGVNTGVLIQTASGTWSATNITVSSADTQGIYLLANTGAGTVSSSTVSGPIQFGVLVGNSNMTALTISGVTASGYSTAGFRVDASSGATSSNITFSGCAANSATVGSTADGFQAIITSGVTSNITFSECTADGATNDGFATYGAVADVVFTRCTAKNNGTNGLANSGDGFTTHSTPTVSLYSNLAYDNWRDAFGIGSTGGTINIYGNTAYSNGTNVEPTSGGGCLYTGSATGATINFKNNICQDNYPYELRWKYGQTVVADNNLYLHTGNGATESKFASVDLTDDSTDNEVEMTWATYHTTNAKETSSLYADPLFVSAATGDFHLQAASPAIGSGQVLADTYQWDCDGKSHKARPWSIGALDYGPARSRNTGSIK